MERAFHQNADHILTGYSFFNLTRDYLDQCFSNTSVQQNPLESLFKHFLIQ